MSQTNPHFSLGTVKEEDKTLINKEMKRLYYLGILKEGFHPTPSQ